MVPQLDFSTLPLHKERSAMIAAPDASRIRHDSGCCALRDESGCCCVTGRHMREDMEHWQRTPLDMTDDQIRQRYWIAQWENGQK